MVACFLFCGNSYILLMNIEYKEDKQVNIKKIFKKNKVVSEVSKIEQCSCVNVQFLTSKKRKDETELTVEHNILTKAGIEELNELFCSLVKELDTTPDSVTGITIVASANSKAALEHMGY